jgi:hypothetical protein
VIVNVRRYQIAVSKVPEGREHELFATILRWAAPLAKRFTMLVDGPRYDDREAARTLASFGRDGALSEELIDALARYDTPPAVVEGIGSPVDYVILLEGDRAVYAVYDYGSGQTVDVTEDELRDLRDALRDGGFPDGLLIAL